MTITELPDISTKYSHITADQVTEAVIKLGTDYPDAVYPNATCLYTKGKVGPGRGCIFGQALQSLGVSILDLEDFDTDNAFDDSSIEILCDEFRMEFRPEWLAVQVAQDDRNTWGEAIKRLGI